MFVYGFAWRMLHRQNTKQRDLGSATVGVTLRLCSSPQPDQILTESDLARTIRNDYVSPAFLKMPTLLRDDRPTSVKATSFQLTYNQQVRVEAEEQQGEAEEQQGRPKKKKEILRSVE